MSNIVGIDASLTNTAVVIGDGREWHAKEFPSKSLGEAVADRVMRYDLLVASILDYLKSHFINAIYIESYSFGHNLAGQSRLCELGGILRWHLVDLSNRIVEVPPTTLKKFVTGKGNAPKDVMLAHIQKRWEQLFESNDVGDAFGLYQLGLVAEGIVEPATVAMAQAVKGFK
ncbi:Crossover junction endodeoxyribonuclease RuvC [Planctomycetes bacterium Pan216]|uniref:Crossover junction endodeoxyribonuclease RuvC n=1 Tax=Kolteria novifilia TaxID=2527975 RepID=A0A518B2P8_9BACT|nr:Crossover junction endodeoxyribonuclease RuvC [Planctomycetes bacterium Pan216]